MPDMINHPPHYTSTPWGLEVIEITRHFDFDLGNALKYIMRAGRKGLGDNAGKELGPVDAARAKVADLSKALWYVSDEIKQTMREFPEYDLLGQEAEHADVDGSAESDDKPWERDVDHGDQDELFDNTSVTGVSPIANMPGMVAVHFRDGRHAFFKLGPI